MPTMPTFNKVDMMNCAAGHHDFSDDASECHVCGHKEAEASAPADDGLTAAELQRVRDRANNLECLLAQAVEEWPQFDRDGDGELNVSGADLVDWFGEWRERARALLDA
jgi:hypothetical protein